METLQKYLRAPDANVLFLTGAGISLASGIPTFRGSDPDAIWSKDVVEKATRSFFLRHPEQSWKWYLDRFNNTRHAKPNPAHIALVDIEAKVPTLRVITQNVDGLHYQAGTKNLVEVHGSARKVRCTNQNCVNGPPKGLLDWTDELLGEFSKEPTRKNVPRCPHCGKFLRPHILWFDESYLSHTDYNYPLTQDWYEEATVLIAVGTSFSVNITNMVTWANSDRGIPVYVIDPHLTDSPTGTILIREAAEVFLPQLVATL